jgi:tRNA1Val (adenine37-N6)-methyltransferase
MKVGTDGILLGALAQGGENILDVGTGSGVVALMMAQRFPKSKITGIDIDANACIQAKENVVQSPFVNISISNISLQDFTVKNYLFDCIVSNPPFFKDSLKCPDKGRTLARHNDALPCSELFKCVSKLLADEGIFSVIIPVDSINDFLFESYVSGLYLKRKYGIVTKEGKPIKRYILSFTKQINNKIDEVVNCLMDKNNNKSEWFVQITKDFYL